MHNMETVKYNEIIDNLFTKLINHHGSISSMCDKYEICQFNLSKIKSRKRIISVGLFMFLNDTLNYHHLDILPYKAYYTADLSLIDYLNVDNNKVFKNIFNLI